MSLAQPPHVRHRLPCPTLVSEPRLHFAIKGLFNDGLVPVAGGVIDAGANHGEETCMLHDLAGPRYTIHAVEPLKRNRHLIISRWKPGRKNVRLWEGILDAEVGSVNVVASILSGGGGSQLVMTRDGGSKGAGAEAATGTIPALTIDYIMRVSNQSLAFAHLDVEGHELQALKGAMQALAGAGGGSYHGRPALSIEIFIHSQPAYTRELLAFVDGQGYACAAVDEVCGAWADARNLVCLPKGPRVFRYFAKYFLLPVTSTTIFALAPYCLPGGACCPHTKDGKAPVLIDAEKHNRTTKCCSTRACFKRLTQEECAAANALSTTYGGTQQHCGSARSKYGPPRFVH